MKEQELSSINTTYLTENDEHVYFIKTEDSDCSQFEIKFEDYR